MSNRKELFNASVWSTIDTLGNRLIKFIFGIFIARALLPEEVGLVVMIYVFLDIAMVISNSGLQSALVNHKHITQEDRSSVFYWNVIIAIALSIVLFFLAKPIAVFFGNANIESILTVLCVVPVINAFSIVHVAFFHRDMNLKALAMANFPATIVPSIIALVLAHKGFGYWSLVVQQLLYTFIFSVILWFLSPFRPTLIFSTSSIKKLKNYALNLLGAELINKIFNNIYFVVIGKFYTPATLGFYSKANSLASLPSQSITAIFSRVAFPAISKIKEKPNEVSALSSYVLTYSTLFIWPFMAFLTASAENLIPFLLTEKWNASIKFMELLCIWGAIQATNKVNMDILQGGGWSNLVLKAELIHKSLIIISLLLTFNFGVLFIIYGQIVSSLFLLILLCAYCSKVLKNNFIDLLKLYLPYLTFSIVIFLIIEAISKQTDFSYGIKLGIQFLSYIIVYLFLLLLFKRKTILKLFQHH